MAKNKIITGEGFVTFEWGDGSRTISVNPNFVYVSLFEDTLSFTLVGVPRPTGLSLFTTRYDDFELNGSTFGSADEALEAILEAFEAAGASFRWIIVDELPATGQSNVMYLLRIPNPELGNIFEEYIWVENDWELVGSNGGSSIRTIYVGTSADSVDSGTCIINKVEGKKEWLNIVYVDSDGFCSMTKVNLGEFILENEFESGVTVNDDGIVYGVVDPRQTKVVVEYDLSGNPITSGDVLSVNASGFTVDRIQDAINAKVLIDRRLYTPNEGEYNKVNQEIAFKSGLDDSLFIVDLSGDTALDSGSTNFVENSAITKAFEDVQDNIISSTTYVASSHTIEYNNRNDAKLFETVLNVDNALDSGSTNPVVNSAVTEAINDLEERKADWVSAVTSGDVVTEGGINTLSFYNRSGNTLFDIELPNILVDEQLSSGSSNPVANSAITEAIENLEERKAEWLSAVTSGDISGNTIEFYNKSGDTLFDIELPEGKVYEAGRAIKITTGATADTISFDLPIYSGNGKNSVYMGYTRTGGAGYIKNAYQVNVGYNPYASGNKIDVIDGSSGNTIFAVGNGLGISPVTPHSALDIRQDGSIYIADIYSDRPYYQKPMILLQDAIGGDSVKGDENTIHTEINADDEKVVSSLVYVNKITTGLPETVKERYQLVGADGNPYTTASGDTSANIDIYKDSHIVSITYITGTTDPHYQNLEYKYIDVSGNVQTTYVDISEIIIEAEVGDGLEVDSHIIKGKIDPASERVVTEYTTAGTSAQTEEVLTVGENGFKASNIQLAIDTKAEVNHKLYDVVNGVYEVSSHTISFVSENDDLFDTELTFDNAFNSGSTNAVQNKVVAEALNDLETRKAEKLSAVTDGDVVEKESAYTLNYKNESGNTLFSIDVPKSDGKPINEGTDIKIVSGETADTIYVSADTEINSASTRVVQAKTIHTELEKKQKKNVELTQDAYDALVSAGTVDQDVLYIISDAEPIDVSKFVTSGSVFDNTSAYTLSFSGNNGNLFDLEILKGGDGKKMIEGTNIKITSGETADTIAVSASTAITSASTEVVTSKAIYDALEEKQDVLSAGTSITIDSANTISALVDDELDSGSTNPVANSAITAAFDEKLDKDYYVNQHYPKGTVITTTTSRNPGEYLGGTWNLIGGEDADSVYYPAFAISGDSGLEVVDESLPNVSAKTTGNLVAHGPGSNTGALSFGGGSTAGAGGSGSMYYGNFTLDLSDGNSVYQDGAQVKVKSLKLFFWERVDDSEVIEPYTPLTCGSGVSIDNGVISSDWKNFVDIQHPQGSVYITYEYKNPGEWLGGEWELIGGSDDSKTYWPAMAIATDAAGTVVNESLPNINGVLPMHNQGAISISGSALFSTTGTGDRYTVDGANASTTQDKLNFNASRSSSVYQDGAQVAVESIKLFYWRRTDNATVAQSVVPFTFTNEINSASTEIEGASAKAVYDLFSGIEFVDRSKEISWGGGTASFNADITCEANEKPLGKGATSVQTGGGVGYGYVLTITKLSDTSYRFFGWANGNGCTGVTVNAVFVKRQ